MESLSTPPIAIEQQWADVELVAPPPVYDDRPSWPMAIYRWVSRQVSLLFGVFSLIFILAVLACIPVLQFLSYGYLLEVAGRTARTGKLSQGLIGLEKASRIGRFVLGTWLLLWPLRYISFTGYNAALIDPNSVQTRFLAALQVVATILIVAHIVAAWICGGRLRHFFWPLVAPFSFAIWIARKAAGSEAGLAVLQSTIGLVSPKLVNELVEAKPITDWFLPAVLFRELFGGGLWTRLRDGTWDFVSGLRIQYYFWLGVRGLIGCLLWLALPTLLMIFSTVVIRTDLGESGDAQLAIGLILGFGSICLMAAVFAFLPVVQTQFAANQSFRYFFKPLACLRVWRSSPIWHWIAIVLMCVLAFPLFFFQIEQIPSELLWTLALFFIVLTWPAKLMLGLAAGRASKRDRPRPWYLAFPIIFLVLPFTFSYCLILYFTQFTSWSGAWGLLENHVFLLPAPFWLG